jgi:UDP:flavonoid glycosyltransferase YjiC (YdhE family)
MKILLNAQGSQGDVSPFLPLALALREGGHRITICAPPNFESFFTQQGFDFYPLGPDTKRYLAEKKNKIASPFKSVKFILNAFRESIPYYFTNLPPLAQNTDLLLGTGVDLCGRSVAEYIGIPYRYIASIPQLLKSSFYPPATVPYQNFPNFINNILWGIQRLALDYILGLNTVYNKERAKLGLNKINDAMSYMVENTILAVNRELFAAPQDVKTSYTQTGYFCFEEEKELSDELESFLEGGKPPIFLGFGSMSDKYPQKTRKVIQDVIDSGKFRIILSSGWADMHLVDKSGRVLNIDYVPYSKLFPKVAAIVHHGGVGTVHYAALAGKPQIIIPHMLDQYFWGNRIFSLGLGPKPINRTRLSGNLLIRALNRALSDDPNIRIKAKKVAAKMLKRDPIQETVNILDRLQK